MACIGLAFNQASTILNGANEKKSSDARPSLLNMAYSLELLFKAILARKGVFIPTGAIGHKLVTLSQAGTVQLNKDQLETLELLTGILEW